MRALAVPWPVRITGQMCAAALALHDRLERPVAGGHDPPGLEVRNALFDDATDLVDLLIEPLLPIQWLVSSGLNVVPNPFQKQVAF